MDLLPRLVVVIISNVYLCIICFIQYICFLFVFCVASLVDRSLRSFHMILDALTRDFTPLLILPQTSQYKSYP